MGGGGLGGGGGGGGCWRIYRGVFYRVLRGKLGAETIAHMSTSSMAFERATASHFEKLHPTLSSPDTVDP